ncbi:MAG: hypothetical protein ACHQVK_03875, partial [Candidatus Paceibacterales bacterium]
VYGLLNQSDTAQYIKINKAFLGPGNALQMAQVFDSITYGNQITVQLEQWKSGSKVTTITLSKDSSIAKPAGIFSYPKQILYKTKAALDEASQYNLVITNNATHNIITGSTQMISSFPISKPFSASINFTNTVNPFVIEWQSAVNGKIYGLTLRFHYLEEDKTTAVVTPKYIDWVFGNQTSLSTLGGETMSVDFMGEAFYQYLQYKIPVDGNVKRYLPTSGSHIDFIFSVGTSDLNTYILVSQPSTGIIQEKPQYTNLKNGFGLFSSRYTQTKTGYQLTLVSTDSLYGGTFTKNIFCDPNPLSPNHCF